jgi:hypothetical protein
MLRGLTTWLFSHANDHAIQSLNESLTTQPVMNTRNWAAIAHKTGAA